VQILKDNSKMFAVTLDGVDAEARYPYQTCTLTA
jgi:hypothetical protein